jgi:hypothetical protein
MLMEGIDEGKKNETGGKKEKNVKRCDVLGIAYKSVYEHPYIHISARKMRGIIVQNEFFFLFSIFSCCCRLLLLVLLFFVRFCIKILRFGMGKDT